MLVSWLTIGCHWVEKNKVARTVQIFRYGFHLAIA
jgi:hypothetical protein